MSHYVDYFRRNIPPEQPAPRPAEITLADARRTRQSIAKLERDGHFLRFSYLSDRLQCYMTSRIVGRDVTLDYYRKTRQLISKPKIKQPALGVDTVLRLCV